MARPGSNRNPTFFWQGLLILLPVALLAGIGLLSVRQDKLLAENDAAQRAQAIADELLPRLRTALTETNRPDGHLPPAFEVDPSGRLVSPPLARATPVPTSPDLSSLAPDQLRLWLAASAAELSGQDPGAAAKAYRDFLSANPPGGFAALAQYSLGLLLAKAGNRAGAKSSFESVWRDYPDVTGSSGLPLKPLAGLKLLELQALPGSSTNQPQVELLNSVCSNAVWNPTPLSSEILDRVAAEATNAPARAAAAQWRQLWQGHELARELFAAAAESPAARLSAGFSGRGKPQAFWLTTAEPLPVSSTLASGHQDRDPVFARAVVQPTGAPAPQTAAVPDTDQSWLALRTEIGGSNGWFVCRSQSQIGADLTALVLDSRQIPEYFGIGLDVAGKHLTWPAPDRRQWEYENYFGRGGGGQKKVYLPELATNVLASAAVEGEPALVKVSVYLTSRSALLAREQARAFWLAALVAAAALAAGVGFFKAYRAFHRQLRLSELKSNFVSSVSHELRAPIASVRLMAESLERGKVPETAKQREYFRFIVQECRRLSSLVENVLDFSRIEQGRKQYDFEPTDLGALTEQTVKLLEPYAAERQVALELRVQNLQPATCNLQLNADGKALQQALVNLVDNAIKHSPKGQTVTVGLERQTAAPAPVSSGSEPGSGANSEPGGTILLWVEDRGEGIPAAEHEKIFERFYRRGSELRRETQGVGIGLSIVKHIVEAHQGRVQLRSDVGKGSRFTIVLPAGNETAPNGQ